MLFLPFGGNYECPQANVLLHHSILFGTDCYTVLNMPPLSNPWGHTHLNQPLIQDHLPKQRLRQSRQIMRVYEGWQTRRQLGRPIFRAALQFMVMSVCRSIRQSVYIYLCTMLPRDNFLKKLTYSPKHCVHKLYILQGLGQVLTWPTWLTLICLYLSVCLSVRRYVLISISEL